MKTKRGTICLLLALAASALLAGPALGADPAPDDPPPVKGEGFRTLVVYKAGTGKGTVTSDPPGINCGAECVNIFPLQGDVKLTASPDPGSRFVRWNGYEFCTTSNPCIVTMDHRVEITATFNRQYTLTVNKAGSGKGTVTMIPPGSICGPDCMTHTENYDAGTRVTLKATPRPNSRFGGWSGDCSGVGDNEIRMGRNKTCTATFIRQYPLTVTKDGCGSGTVTSTPPGINCGPDCTEKYDSGTLVTLTAIRDPGVGFGGWSGDASSCGRSETCQVRMGRAKTATATFISVYNLTVAKDGSGTGTVTGGGIDCGTNCAKGYECGAVVTLTAKADPGSRFSTWKGACSGSSPTCTVTMDARKTVTATFIQQYTLTVNKTGTGVGTVTSSPPGIDCGSDCTERYDSGKAVTLQATPAAGSRFGWWSGVCSGSSPTCQVTMNQAKTVTATFIREYKLTVTKAGSGTGTVTSSPPGIDCGSDCAEKYDSGNTVTLQATPAAGSRFDAWSGACSGSSPTCQVTMNQAKTVTATFIRQYTLTVRPDGCGTGTVTSSPQGINCPTDCTEKYDSGTVVMLTARRNPGVGFGGWGGDASSCGISPTCLLTINRPMTVTVTFISVYTLTVVKDGTGTGTVTGGGMNCGTVCAKGYECESRVTLTAIPDAGSRFAGWSGGGCFGTSPCTVTMNAAKTVTATFNRQHLLTVNTVGSGTVTSNPPGINCGSDCTELYDQGTAVTLTATPAAGWRFDHWSGACAGTDPTYTVTMGQARTCAATFIRQYRLTVAKDGTGDGLVASNPPGITCGSDCTETYDANTQVTLTATPAAGSRFVVWSGGGCSGREVPTCTVTMAAARTVTATFNRQHLLTVVKEGTGHGTVECGQVGLGCTGLYDEGTDLMLTVRPGPCSVFAGWNEPYCGPSPTCIITINRPTTIIVTFNLMTFPLTVLKAGTGDGTVTTSPPGISCPPGCTTDTADYDCETRVRLTASWNGSTTDFGGWSDPTCGMEPTCTVTMTEPATITATFNGKTFPLTVVKNGTGDGTVTSSPPGINCGSDCTEDYDPGTTVVLTATRGVVWSGACSGTSPTCTVTMDAAKTVTATFIRRLLLTVNKNGTGDGTVISNPTGIDCRPGCNEQTVEYDQETVVTLEATADADSRFTGWSGSACQSSQQASPCTVTISEATTVTATFMPEVVFLFADGFESGDLSMWSGWVMSKTIVVAGGDSADGSQGVVHFSLDLQPVRAAGPGPGTVHYDVVGDDGRVLGVLDLMARRGRLSLVGAIAAEDGGVVETPLIAVEDARDAIEIEWVVPKDAEEPTALTVDDVPVWAEEAPER